MWLQLPPLDDYFHLLRKNSYFLLDIHLKFLFYCDDIEPFHGITLILFNSLFNINLSNFSQGNLTDIKIKEQTTSDKLTKICLTLSIIWLTTTIFNIPTWNSNSKILFSTLWMLKFCLIHEGIDFYIMTFLELKFNFCVGKLKLPAADINDFFT